MIRLKTLLEQIDNEFDFPGDSIIDKPGYGNTGYADLDKTPYTDFEIPDTYNVFISGLETSTSHQSQVNYFKKGYTPQTYVPQDTNVILKPFSKYNTTGITKFFNDPPGYIGKVVLFSAGCTWANEIASMIGRSNEIYCVEPWVTTDNKKTWTEVPEINFYVHPTYYGRGAGATDGEMNSTPAKQGHLANLTWAVQQIFS